MVKDGRGRWVSEANLGTAEALVSPTTGELAEVATYRAGQRIVSPDVGWSYNPGQAWMEPFTLRPFDPDLGGGYKSVGAAFHPKTPLAELAAKRLDPGLLLPPHQASGWSEAQYVNTFLTEFGARADTPVVFRDVIDDPLVISAELFRDRKSNTFKVFKGDREIYLRLLADTIKDPVEIWLSEVELGGRVRICKRYVGLYQNEQQKAGGYVIFDLVDDHWQGTTAFRPERLTYLETQRVGTLLYTKK